MNEHRGYHAIILAIVRYDNHLNGGAKLLYGELTALMNEKGYYWVTNQYFVNLYNVSKRTIISWLRQLEKRNYIKIQIFYESDSKVVDQRHIYILPYPTDTEFYTPSEEDFATYGKNHQEGDEENFTENNILINNTKNDTENIYSVEQGSTVSELFKKVWRTYPKKTNKKKVKEQLLRKIKSGEGFEQFKTGYRTYLKYIKLNDRHRPQELFRWIRDERFNDECDLSETAAQVRYSNNPVRREKLPDQVDEPKKEEERLSPEKQAELDRRIREYLEGK